MDILQTVTKIPAVTPEMTKMDFMKSFISLNIQVQKGGRDWLALYNESESIWYDLTVVPF